MTYIDGFVAAVPTANKAQYLQHVTETAGLFKEFGASEVVECWGDDVPAGELTSFPMAVQCRPEETVVFAWVMWPSREARNLGMKKMMEDPRMVGATMPFDGKRLIYGGFEVLLNRR